jgi:DNA modification methylase
MWGTRNRANGKYHNEGTGLTPHSELEKQYEYRNKRDVWTVNTKANTEAHFATYSIELIEPAILAGTREGDTILDPFMGSGTTALGCIKHNRNFIGIDVSSDYCAIAERRIKEAQAQCKLELV